MAAILTKLPPPARTLTFEELGLLLFEALPAIASTEDLDPTELGNAFLKLLVEESYDFSIPIARLDAPRFTPLLIGGRFNLLLALEASDIPEDLCVLTGRVTTTYWAIAHRLVSELVDEVVGLLMAADVLLLRAAWHPRRGRMAHLKRAVPGGRDC